MVIHKLLNMDFVITRDYVSVLANIIFHLLISEYKTT